ncbi:MAG: C10 family peptidase [Alistipes sp.]|nr:C10 family peptidase [Alistipes sp.]
MKRLLTLLILLGLISTAHAGEVGTQRALSIAQRVLGDATRSSDVVVAWDSSLFSTTRVEVVEPTFYVVRPTSGPGFVIVSGDDVVAPVLAYSTTYYAPTMTLLPRNFEAWLRYVDTTVRRAREQGVKQSSATAELWAEEYKPVGALMLNTARWSQMAPYNYFCPVDNGAYSLTGCTQTAMAVIMKHHRWPESAKGVTEAYTTMYGLPVPARDLNHAYDWDSMLDSYVEGYYTTIQATAVAVLMADLGHAFKAEYTANDTAAMPDMMSLYQNFSYSPASQIVTRGGHSDSYWKSMLRGEIETNRPVFYAGYTSDWAGHAFVIDGVDDNDYFHVNWGWGGVYDGFFLIDNLILGEEYLFDTEHWAVFGMHPLRDGEIDNWISLYSTGLNVEPREFTSGEPFTIRSISYCNFSQLSFKGQMRVGLADLNGEFKSWVSEPFGVDLGVNYATSEQYVSAIINDNIEQGDRLYVYYKSNTSEKWFRMRGSVESASDEVIVKYPPIGDNTSLSFDRSSGLVVVEYDDDVKAALYLLSSSVESGVTITRGRMTIDTRCLSPGVYTIYLVREGVEDKRISFQLNRD